VPPSGREPRAESVVSVEGRPTIALPSPSGCRPAAGSGLNAAFVDGHARWVPGAEFWRIDRDGSYRYRYAAADR
jgi:prepilin-type processing-associated H-X9-DG protein